LAREIAFLNRRVTASCRVSAASSLSSIRIGLPPITWSSTACGITSGGALTQGPSLISLDAISLSPLPLPLPPRCRPTFSPSFFRFAHADCSFQATSIGDLMFKRKMRLVRRLRRRLRFMVF
jgi:hypothetical protein